MTESAALLTDPSLTSSENVSCEPAAGAVNVGRDEVAGDSVTSGPAVCDHANDNASPSGSLDPSPVNSTCDPAGTAWSTPAAATGAVFTGAMPLPCTVCSTYCLSTIASK